MLLLALAEQTQIDRAMPAPTLLASAEKAPPLRRRQSLGPVHPDWLLHPPQARPRPDHAGRGQGVPPLAPRRAGRARAVAPHRHARPRGALGPKPCRPQPDGDGRRAARPGAVPGVLGERARTSTMASFAASPTSEPSDPLILFASFCHPILFPVINWYLQS